MPASGRLLLDTNIVIALLEGDEAVISNLDEAADIHSSDCARRVVLRSGQVGRPAVTRDRHFGEIDDLRIASRRFLA